MGGYSTHIRRGTLLQSDSAQRLQGSLAQQLAVMILSGELPEGHVFPSELDYAEQIGMSRSALREAFRMLSAKGLVESRPKAGTRVASRRQWSLLDPDLLAWQFEAKPSLKFVFDLFELRMVVEPNAAAFAAERRSEAQLAAMGEALDMMALYGLATEKGRYADQRFHMIMMEATQNEAMIALASSILAAIAWTTIYKQRKRALPRDPIPEHRALLDAIAASEIEGARAAMTELVRLALSDTEISLLDEP
ncbi:FadR/GntR family transcriptional regulator [Sphingomonas sp. Root241]|uniref:FadR/GntR family transcriptional regulator n=1 Tax=Sphingomonas sp. Root241 TaxID=1736501 RepID=UPI000AB3B8E4|nr:FadR/GntR family transcriptional regulator [Sphingomonas sp. Root241]